MPEFRDLGQRFRQRLRTLDGAHFFGSISPAPESQGRGNQFFTPRRILNVHPNCTIQSGTIILDTAGRKMLCGWNGEEEFHGIYAQTFKLYDLDRYLSWKRAETVEDPVTGLERQTVETELGPIWCAMEQIGSETDMLRVATSKYRVLTNADLRIGDRFSTGATVRSVNNSLGITIAEVW